MNKTRFALLSFVILFFASCGSSLSLFYIVSVSPENNATNVHMVPLITAHFSEKVKEETLNSNTFYLIDEDGTILESVISYDSTTNIASLVPSKGLLKEKNYYVVLDKEITDEDDNNLLNDYTWQFQTAGFYFLIISDVHSRVPGAKDNADYDNQQNIDNLESVVATINENYSNADFVVVTGDLTGCLFSLNPADYGDGKSNPANLFKSIMDELEMPYYPLLGNHDYQRDYDTAKKEGVTVNDSEIAQIEAVWKKVLNIDPYYSFLHEGINFILLNSNKGSKKYDLCSGYTIESMCTGSFDNEQLDWFENELSSGDKALIFTHHPFYTEDTTYKDWSYWDDSFMIWSGDGVYDVLNEYYNNILAGFVGHGHRIAEGYYLDGVLPIYETGSTGDAFSKDSSIRIVSVIPDEALIEVLYYNSPEE